MTRLGEHLRTIARSQRLTGQDVRTHLSGWDGEAVDAFLNGARHPRWDFIAAFLDAVAGDEPWLRELMEQSLRPLWEQSAEEQAGIKVEQLATRTITLWGPPNSGKTTFIAALNSAVGKTSPPWSLTGSSPASQQALIDFSTALTGDRSFPKATVAQLEHYRFILSGLVRAPGKWRVFYPLTSQVLMRIPLSIVDVPGGAFRPPGLSPSKVTRQLISCLKDSDGIIFLFDAATEAEVGHAYEHFYALAALLEQERGSRLPHHVAVCVAKLDLPIVFCSALEAGYLVVDKNDPHGCPRVSDANAAAFFDRLYKKVHPDGISLPDMIERFFYEDRIRYFAVSSTGFYLNESRKFDPDDCCNHVSGSPDRVRGEVHPMSLLEPLFWLAAPDSYDAAARSRHGKDLQFSADVVGQLGDVKDPATAVFAPSSPESAGSTAHLVCLIEVSADKEIARKRLDRLGQLVSVALHANQDLKMSLITYGTHAVARGFREEPSTVLAWGADSASMTKFLNDVSRNGLHTLMPRGRKGEAEYQEAAQIECALAEVARRLTGATENVALVTVGTQPPFPSRMTSDSQILPCPARSDWKARLNELRTRGVTLGAIHDHAYEYDRLGLPVRKVDEIWAQLGAHANATLDEVDISRFAGAVRLLSPDQAEPYAPDWRPDPTQTWQGEVLNWQGPSLDDQLAGLPDTRRDLPPVRDGSEDRIGIERRYTDDDL